MTCDLGRLTHDTLFFLHLFSFKSKKKNIPTKNQKVKNNGGKSIENAYKGNKKCLKGGVTFGKC